MIGGVEAGSIDAGYVTEPFTTAARTAGLREVVDLFVGPNEKLPMATFVTSNGFADKNPKTVAAFQAALNAASADMNSKKGEFRKFIPTVSQTPPQAAQAMALPYFESDMDLEKLQRTADVVFELGLIDKKVDMSEHSVGAS